MTKAERDSLRKTQSEFAKKRNAEAYAAGPLAVGSQVLADPGTVFATKAEITKVLARPNGFAYEVRYTEGPYAGCRFTKGAGSVKRREPSK